MWVFPLCLISLWVFVPFTLENAEIHPLTVFLIAVLGLSFILIWVYGFLWVYENRVGMPSAKKAFLCMFCLFFSVLAGLYIYLKKDSLAGD
jgi:hypothetical protein